MAEAMDGRTPPPMATPRVAAGALFFDEDSRVLLVQPTYKDGFEVPGGYVEPGESPRDACIREVAEELGILPPIGTMLAVDWAPAEGEGDKLLFLFDGGVLSVPWRDRIVVRRTELAGWRFVATADLPAYLAPRLLRRVGAALEARSRGCQVYLEHGAPFDLSPPAPSAG